MSYHGPPPRRNEHDRAYRDYDRPAEPTRYQLYRDEREDDFSIKGRASHDAERSLPPPREPPRDYARYDGPRERDSRYDGRPSRGGRDYADGYGRDRFARDRYDSTARNGRGEQYGRRGDPPYGRTGYDDRRGSFDPTVDVQHSMPAVEPAYSGDKDVASDGDDLLNFLLVRGLKLNVSAEVFAKGMEKLYRGEDQPEGATPGSLRCVMLICDRTSGAQKSQGFGFAWYHSTSDAVAAHAAAKKREPGFTISSRPVDVDMPHNGVFQRTDFAMRGTEDRFTFVMPATGARYEYKDSRFYPLEHVVNIDPPGGRQSSRSPPSGDAAVSAGPPGRKTKKRASEATDQQPVKKRQVQMSSDMQSLASRWGAARSELKEEVKSREQEQVQEQQSAQTFASDGIDSQERKACWLCKATFTTSEGLVKHLQESDKHAESLQNADLVQQAYKRMEQVGVDPALTLPTPVKPAKALQTGAVQAPEYIDRAANRRAEEARTGNNAGSSKVSFSLKNRNHSASDETSTPAPISKGLNMLQKQGYQAGQGLGSEGRTEPIATDLYAAGVGLGHASSKVGDAVKEAERMTKGGSAGYVEKVRDGAKARYEAAVGQEKDNAT